MDSIVSMFGHLIISTVRFGGASGFPLSVSLDKGSILAGLRGRNSTRKEGSHQTTLPKVLGVSRNCLV